MLVLERSDPAGLVWISSGEMDQGALARRGTDALRRWVGSDEVRSEVGLIALPTGQPAIGGGDGKGTVAVPPDAVERLALGDSANQCQELFSDEVGMGDEMTPEDGEGAAATFVVAAIGTKKRIRLISC